MKNRNRTIAGFVVMTFVLTFSTASAQRAADQEREQQSTRRAEAVSKPVFEKIQDSQAATEKQDFVTALRILNSLLESGSLTEYEKSNVYRYLGYAHYGAEDIAAAIRAFDEVLKIPGLEIQIKKDTLYTLAQLNTVEERHNDALRYMEEWLFVEPNPAPGALILYAQILYQLDRYREMISPIEKALAVANARNLEVKEQWYVLLSFAYAQVENYSKIRDINKILVAGWPKKQYWLYLANAYRELGDDKNFLTAYDAAYLQGFLDTEAEVVTLAQLYLQNEIPFKAGLLLETEMEAGRVSPSAQNFRLLSQAWSIAQEDERSIGPLKSAANLDEDGDLYIRLANVYLNLGRFTDCVDAAKAGFLKGGIKNPDYANISLGMCLFNIQEYAAAIKVFRVASATPRSGRTANQWIAVIKSELQRNEQIALAEALTQKRLDDLANRRLVSDRM